MGTSHGKEGKVKLGTDTVAETTKWSLTQTVPVADTTAQGDTAATHIAGIPNWSGSVEALYDPADTNGQAALTIGASVSLKLYPDGDASGKTEQSGTATVTSIQQDSDVGDANKIVFSFQGNGALATATVV